MTEDEKKRLKEKLWVIAHQFGELKTWEIALINEVDSDMAEGKEPTRLEVYVIEKLFVGDNK